MQNFLVDKALQAEFNRSGFVLLDKFILEEDAQHYKGLIEKAFSQGVTTLSQTPKHSKLEKRVPVDDDMAFTTQIGNMSMQRQVNQELAVIGEKQLGRFINFPCKSALAVGTRKKYSEKGGGEVRPHIHPNRLDPRTSDGSPEISLFIPLVDITDDTGPVGFVRGSHKLWSEEEIVPVTCLQVENTNPHLIPLINNCVSYQYPKVGQAILFHRATIHTGKGVRHGGTRYAWFMDVVPRDSEMLFYFTEYDSAGEEIAALRGKQMLDFPYIRDANVPGIPANKMGKEIHVVEPYEPRVISEAEFLEKCN